jgi:hypothetical protein
VGTQTSPLVTEWPASEKARLQSLVQTQPVAVRFAGCELEVVESCTLPGRYVWQRTALATDTLDIDDKNELFSKLPIGAVKLEGELAQSGKLSVRTTVAGQLSLTDAGDLSALPLGAGCAQATHIVTRMSVGAFKLLSGSDISGRGGVSVPQIGAEAGSSRKESLLRESGDPKACQNSTDQAPANQCASPIQLFLKPLRPEVQAQIVASGAVQIAIPEPHDIDESWSLRDRSGALICRLPCTQWVNPASGYFLQREPARDTPIAKVYLPNTFPHPPGSQVQADYQMERGSPFWSTLTVVGIGAPTTALGAYSLALGIREASESPCSADDPDCERGKGAGYYFGLSTLSFSVASATLWWYIYSQEEQFKTYGPERVSQSKAPRTQVGLGYFKTSF